MTTPAAKTKADKIPFTDTTIPRAHFPLQRPAGRAATPDTLRRESRFRVTFVDAYDGVVRELSKIGAVNAVVSSNVPLSKIGDLFLPVVAAAKRVTDPGVAVHFKRNGKTYVIALDTYETVVGNLRAIENTLKAMRDIERHGAAEMLEQAIGGFLALPPGPQVRPWFEVLGVPETASAADVETAFRKRALQTHPDHGGTPEAFVEVTRARMEAEAAISASAHTHRTATEFHVGVSRIG